MKILHVAPSVERSYGGPSQSLAGFVATSQLNGDSTTIAAPSVSTEAREILVRSGATEVKSFGSTGSGAFVFSPSLLRWIANNASRFDVIHVHGLFNPVSTFGARSAISRGAAVVIRPFGTLSRYTVEHRRTILKTAYFSMLERLNVRDASAIHFTTAAERNDAEWRNLSLGERAFVVPPPFVEGSIPPEIGARDKNVLFVGRLHPVKNIEAVIDAWPAVVAQEPKAHLIIAGGGDDVYLRNLQARAASLGVTSSLSFTGFVDGDRKSRLLSSAAVLCLPSHHENFGIVVLEAVAGGVPVVVSPQVQLRDFVEANELGIVANPDPESLSSALVRCLRDERLAQRLQRCGRATVRATYGPEAIKRSLADMYQSAVQYQRNRRSRSSK